MKNPDLRLMAVTPDLSRSIARGELGELREFKGSAEVTQILKDIGEAYVSLYSATKPIAPWIGYLAILGPSGPIVGTCGFKEKTGQGPVEIAYFTFPGWEGRGIGTDMARLLVEIAKNDKQMRPVIAHTLPKDGASTAILRKLGFANAGQIDDPEEGAVWHWKLSNN